ncbi:MAG: protein kinase [Planctomycetes bacterium]|nr:protein kinase [Planctomycetota bacterium]
MPDSDMTVLEREDRFQDVLLAYFDARDAGQPVDRQQMLATHPEFQTELSEFFAAHDQVERLAGGFRQVCEGVGEPRPFQSEPPSEMGTLGDFRLLREIGRGGMGVIYEAEQVSLRRRVALKLLPFAAALDARQIQRFKNEALAAAQLRHENIVPVYAVGEERGVHYYAMQFIAGRSLATLIAELKVGSGPQVDLGGGGRVLRDGSIAERTAPVAALSTARLAGRRSYFEWVAHLGRQAALALDYAHTAGVVHRDIKPANLLLDSSGKLWITDFGLAQTTGEVGLTMTGELLGTLRYASPEQLQGRRGTVDQRSDIYSLGATLYELLTLEPIFGSRDRHELLRQISDQDPVRPRVSHRSIPPELEIIVLKALGKDPAERYLTARDLADDLQRFQDNHPIRARRPSLSERTRKAIRRHPTLVAACLVLLGVVSAGSTISTVMIRNEQARTRAEQANVQAAFQRERWRAEEAEARFRLARRSVDELFRLSEELDGQPELVSFRRRMLNSVLEFYQEFLDVRRDDPRAQAELVDAKQHVEAILADLAVLRAAGQLYLLVQPAVLDDLQLDGEQRPRVQQFCGRVGQGWLASLDEFGRLSRSERSRRAIERARQYEIELQELLTTAQRSRLQQIGLQAQGASAFADPDVAAVLKLSGPQREEIRLLEEQAQLQWLRRGAASGGAGKSGNAPSSPQIKEQIWAVLTAEQVQRWRELIGPELTSLGTMFSTPAGRPDAATAAEADPPR